MTTLGVISDTHGLVRPEALAALAGCEAILHAGDIGGRHVLEALAGIAPVHAIRGNNDRDRWGRSLPDELDVKLGGRWFHLIHDVNDLGERKPGWDVLVSGHSHRPSTRKEGKLLLLNPGSAGPRRFSLPVTVAIVKAQKRVHAELIDLGPLLPVAASSRFPVFRP